MPGRQTVTLSVYDDVTSRGEPTVMAAELFIILNADCPREPSLRFSLEGVREVTIGRSAEPSPSWQLEREHLVIAWPDARMSSTHARLLARTDGFGLEDLGSKNGLYHNGQKTNEASLQDGDIIEAGHTFFLFRSTRRTWADRDPHPRTPLAPHIPTFVPSFDTSLRALAEVAQASLPVLLLGESGTGKEVVSRAFHEASSRKGSFIGVNCGALPDQLVESELFGSKRGAFSGAVEDRPGLVRAADGGTLFLDEIGDLPPQAQVALLRTLQEREVTAVGATRAVPVDFRLVSATHRDLRAAVKDERFRQDLFARISGLEVHLPALRERREDLGLLIRALIERHRGLDDVRLTRRAMRALLAYDWPANVRELEKALSLAMALAQDEPIGFEHLPDDVRAGPSAPDTATGSSPVAVELNDEERARRDELLALLTEHKGNVTAVARQMGKARMQIHRWMKRFGIDPNKLRD